FLLYPALMTPVFGPFFIEPVVRASSGGLHVPLGRTGYIFMIIFVLGLVPAMALLERTLRTSRGIYRWQVKFLVLGIISYLGARVFTASLSILFHSVDLNMETLNSGALIVAAIFLIGSFVRTRVLPTEIFISPRVILGSITVTLVGLYLLAIGIIAQVAVSTGSNLPLEALAFLIFLAFLGFSILFLSDRVRQTLKKFISRHFQRPLYDYRHIWEVFTQRISPIMDTRMLCGEAAKLISETMEILSVNILLPDDSGGGWHLFGSTAHSEISSADLAHVHKALDQIFKKVVGRSVIIDIQGKSAGGISFLSDEQRQSLEKLRMRYFLSLQTGKTSLGLLAIDEKVRYLDLTIEEEDLTRTLAGHLASSIQNVRLSDKLREAREMETLRKFAAFFVHDLKNLASKLSMTLQNLPEHFDNPEFREDALRLISQSVEKINTMTGRMSLLREKLEVKPIKVDLNELVKSTLIDLADIIRSPILVDYSSLPEITLDPEQIGKVLTNLILNAHEANEKRGDIRIRTDRQGEWIVLSVGDSGCGMSSEFMEKSLFKPFQTTKEHGLGIGLYHCKTILDEHQGRIEVKSRLGRGSTFRVFLPINLE
ncbi:PEP-CTERM system histidine kinase PrsK, partial [bacterium]|nr:PEP-CTERM system histidine kinase PrsK [bacterium]